MENEKKKSRVGLVIFIVIIMIIIGLVGFYIGNKSVDNKNINNGNNTIEETNEDAINVKVSDLLKSENNIDEESASELLENFVNPGFMSFGKHIDYTKDKIYSSDISAEAKLEIVLNNIDSFDLQHEKNVKLNKEDLKELLVSRFGEVEFSKEDLEKAISNYCFNLEEYDEYYLFIPYGCGMTISDEIDNIYYTSRIDDISITDNELVFTAKIYASVVKVVDGTEEEFYTKYYKANLKEDDKESYFIGEISHDLSDEEWEVSEKEIVDKVDTYKFVFEKEGEYYQFKYIENLK